MSASLKRSLSLGFWTKILYFCLIFLLHTVSQGCTDFLKIWELPKNSAPEWWHEGRALQGSTNLCNIIQTLVTTVTCCLGFMHPCFVSQASHPRFNLHNNWWRLWIVQLLVLEFYTSFCCFLRLGSIVLVSSTMFSGDLSMFSCFMVLMDFNL